MLRLYSLVMGLVLPLALLRLLGRSLKAPAYRRRWRERLGFYPERPLASAIWIHAVSVGEVQAAQLLIKRLLARYPGQGILVTTTTPTGSSRLRSLFAEQVRHVYMPYDLQWVVRRFLRAVRPRLAVVMETEIWPNMLCLCAAQGIPVVLANARLSERSARGYARFGSFARTTLRRFAAIAAQGPADAQRFLALGVEPAKIEVTGSLKFDLAPPASLQEQAEAMRRAWGPERPVWVAASTHEGEEGPVLEAHARVRERLPRTLLVLVPRHPERFERVGALVARRGLSLVRRSEAAVCDAATAVFLGDTMGELPVFLAAADAAFIGGSLVPVGGHNLLEAAAAGVPVVVGPHVFNFAEITALLVQEGAALQVSDAEQLAQLMGGWLSDAAQRARIGEHGRHVVAQNRGALDRLMALIENTFPPGAARAR